MTKIQYWTEREDLLCLKWQECQTERDYQNVYNDLLPSLRRMAEIILKRYFNAPSNRQAELQKDAITEVFIKLHKFNYKKGKSYSFCGLVIKHFYHETLVFNPKQRKSFIIDLGVEIDSIKDYPLIEYDSTYIDDEIYYKLSFEFKKRREKYIKIWKSEGIKIIDFYIKILENAIEYVETYKNCNPTDIVMYVASKLNVNSHRISYFLRKEFKIPFTHRILESSNDEKRKGWSGVDDRYNWINDDYVPIDSKIYKRDKKKKLAKKITEYNDFLYF